jgi:hypothetical protein
LRLFDRANHLAEVVAGLGLEVFGFLGRVSFDDAIDELRFFVSRIHDVVFQFLLLVLIR